MSYRKSMRLLIEIIQLYCHQHQAEMKSQRMIVVFLEKMILMKEIAKERALLIIIKYHLLIQEQIQ